MANTPGKSTRQMAKERRVIRRTLGVLGLAALADIVLCYFSLPAAIGFPFALAGLWAVNHYFIGWMDFVFRRERQADRGAKAEEAVGAILNRLPDNHRVLHDVPKEFGNIDHLVFRADGAIFLIETKSHHGCVTVQNGEFRRDDRPLEKNFVNQTLDNVTWLKSFLKTRYRVQRPWIHAAVVFTNAYVPQHCEVHNVAVIHQTYLERWMANQPGKPEQAAKLWPRMEKVEAQLLETVNIRAHSPLAPSFKTLPASAASV